MADLQDYLGGIPARRILLNPTPGTATEADALRLDDHEDRLCELIDGILVEKDMSTYESIVATMLSYILNVYLDAHPIGIVTGEGGQLRLRAKQIRIPDVAFLRWDRFPGGKLPRQAVYNVVPDLAVEILSAGNTSQEMQTKLHDDFDAGVRLVWYIDPTARTATQYTSPDDATTIDADGVLDGRDVLPGFTLRLGDLLAKAERQAPPQ